MWTGGGTVELWPRDFSHEILEMLVDPDTNRSVYHGRVGQMVEVADPGEWDGYRLNGVFVSDFVLPAWSAGATTGEPTWVGFACSFPRARVRRLRRPVRRDAGPNGSVAGSSGS